MMDQFDGLLLCGSEEREREEAQRGGEQPDTRMSGVQAEYMQAECGNLKAAPGTALIRGRWLEWNFKANEGPRRIYVQRESIIKQRLYIHVSRNNSSLHYDNIVIRSLTDICIAPGCDWQLLF